MNNFVLSLMHNDSQMDFLINQHFDDAFYSLSKSFKYLGCICYFVSLVTDSQKVFHGLDTLIYHYSHNPITDGLFIQQPCIGEPPPVETRLHGSSNLLHRAVSSGKIIRLSLITKY